MVPVQGQERELLDAVFAKAMQPRRAVVLVDFLDHQPKGRAARELRTKLMQDLCFCLEACSAQPCLSVIVLVNTARPEMLSAELLKDIKHKLLVSLPDVRNDMPMSVACVRDCGRGSMNIP